MRTVFNLLGPLTNPAGARRQLVGVSDPAYLETMAGALARLGDRACAAGRGEDGLDELSIVGADAGGRGRRRRAVARTRSSPSDVGLRARPRRARVPGGDARAERRRSRGGSSPASPARRGTSRCSTPAPRSTPPAARHAAEGVRPRARRSTTGAAAAALERFVPRTRGAGARSDRARPDRRAHPRRVWSAERRRREVRSPSSSAASPRARASCGRSARRWRARASR